MYSAQQAITAARWWDIPFFVLLLFFADLALAAAYLINVAIGFPTRLLNLSGEGNLPAWYASTKLAVVAALLCLFDYCRFEPSRPRSWSLVALALLFLALSADETAQIHERLGDASDALLPGGTREDTALHQTGIWMFVIGLPGVAVLLLLIWAACPYLRAAPGLTAKYLAGVVILATGALGVETLANFTEAYFKAHTVQICLEEFLEMVGVTVLLWGTIDLLRTYRVRLSFALTEPLVASRPR